MRQQLFTLPFQFQCGIIVGLTDTGIEVCPLPAGHDGECVRSSHENPRRAFRLCRNLIDHPVRREHA